MPAEVEGLLQRDVHGEVHHLLLEAGAITQELLVPLAHAEAHGLLFGGVLVLRVELDHRVHDGAVILAGVLVDLLLETGEGAEGLDAAVAEVELALGDIARVVRDGVRHVVAGHGGHGKDGDGAGALEVDGLLVTGGELGVEVAGIATVGGDLLHGDGDFLHRIGEGGHVREQDEDALALEGELLGHGQRDVRHEHALHHGVGRGVDEHHGAREGAGGVKLVAEGEVVVVLQAHTAQDDHIDLGLEGDAGEELIIGLAGAGEDGELLALDEGVEDIDHRDAGAHHVTRNDTLGGVDRRRADVGGVHRQLGAVVTRLGRAGEDAAEELIAEGHLHRVAQEAHLRIGRHAAGAGEDLKGDLVAGEFDDLRQGRADARVDFGEFAVLDALRTKGDDGAGNVVDLVIELTHGEPPRRS